MSSQTFKNVATATDLWIRDYETHNSEHVRDMIREYGAEGLYSELERIIADLDIQDDISKRTDEVLFLAGALDEDEQRTLAKRIAGRGRVRRSVELLMKLIQEAQLEEVVTVTFVRGGVRHHYETSFDMTGDGEIDGWLDQFWTGK